MATFEKVVVRRAAGVSSEGVLKANENGLEWKSDAEQIKIEKLDLKSLKWTPLHFGFQLTVSTSDGNHVHFTGLKHEAHEKLAELNLTEIRKEEFCTKGHNWGKLDVDGKAVIFGGTDSKPFFTIPLPEVSTVQFGKDDVTFEFGGTTDVREGEEMLVGMSFHVPTENEDFPMPLEDDDEVEELRDPERHQKRILPAERFYNVVLPHTDLAAKSERPIAIFNEVTVLVPRGRFEVQLHHSYMKMLGQAQDFKIRYNSIMRLFILPKPNPPTTVVVVALDSPIRKGQTFYNHVLFQFDTEEEMSLELNLSQEELDAKNEQNKCHLVKEMTSMAHDVFGACLQGLSGKSTTAPRTFANFANDGNCVRCSYKTDEGYLFPLEREFFYIHKPPLWIAHNEISSIEFQRQGTNVVSANVKTFDLCIRTKQGAEHQFRGIQRNEWQPLFNFFEGKELTVENDESVRQGPMPHKKNLSLNELELDGRPSHDDDDDSDPDFAVHPDQEEEEDGEGNDSDSSSSGAEIIDEAQLSDPGSAKEDSDEEPTIPVAESSNPPTKPSKKQPRATNEDEGGKRKRRKKDKNAPKKNLSAYMFYSQANREKVIEEFPGIPFGEVGKVLGTRWRELTDADKAPYQELAEKDKARYEEEKAKYDAQMVNQAPPEEDK